MTRATSTTKTRATRSTGGPRRLRAGPIQIIATPGSGDGRALADARALRDAFGAHGRRTRLRLFRDLEGLHRWAERGTDAFSLLCSVGGDGTQSAAAGAALRRGVPFLPIPRGFGNLFARALRQPGRSQELVGLLDHGVLLQVDVGLRNGELFLCQESFGLLSDIQLRAEASTAEPRPRWRRWLGYYATALRHLREAPLTPLQVVVDDRVVARNAALVTVANVPTYGPWLPLTPAASPVDGSFDVFVMRGASKRRILTGLLRRHLRVPGVEPDVLLCRGRRVVITSPRSHDQLDLLPRRLTVLVSRETAAALKRDRTALDAGPDRRLDGEAA